jgi:hypothetical protein
MRSFRDRHPPAPGSLLFPGRERVLTVGRLGRPLAHAANDNRRAARQSGPWSVLRRMFAPRTHPAPTVDGRLPRVMARAWWPGVALGVIGVLLAFYWA